MEVSFVSEFTGGCRVFRFVEGDVHAIGLEVGGSDPCEDAYYATFCCFSQTPNHSLTERIRAVLDGSELTMVFQPIVDLVSARAVGVEALARFAAEPRRSPDQWFAEAWTAGLGIDLELFAARSAVAELDRLAPHVVAPNFAMIVGRCSKTRKKAEDHGCLDRCHRGHSRSSRLHAGR